MIIKQAPTGHGSDWMPSKCLSVWLLTNCLKAFPKVECINHTYVGAKHFLCVFIILFGKYLIKWWYRHMLVNGERERERERQETGVGGKRTSGAGERWALHWTRASDTDTLTSRPPHFSPWSLLSQWGHKGLHEVREIKVNFWQYISFKSTLNN